MQYFFPVAGLIVLVFVLMGAFSLFTNHIDSREAEEARQRAVQQQTIRQNNYDECLADAESRKASDYRYRNTTFQRAELDPGYHTAMDSCMRMMSMDHVMQYFSDERRERRYQQNQNFCRNKIVEEMLAPYYSGGDYTTEGIEMRYEQARSECRTKYGF